MKEKNIVLIPAYEPEEKLIHLVEDLSKEKLDILVVDDGSGLKYKEIFNSCKVNAKVISYKTNKGKGYALKTGLKYIQQNYKKPYILVTMDSDGQHTIKDAKKLIKECINNKDTLYLGKRKRNEKTPIKSRIGNGITRLIYKIVAKVEIYDTQTGLRAFSNELIDYMIEIEGNRFEYELNVLLKCAKDKIKMKEIDIETIYINNNSGTHFNALKDSYRIYKDIIKFSLSQRKDKK